jgi:hypothetical protein
VIDLKLDVEVDPYLLETFSKVEQLGKALKDGGFSSRAGQEVLERGIRPYPPPPPHSTYVRTYKLFNSWHLVLPSPGEGGDIFIVESKSPDYNADVQQEGSQAWMHRNRWQTDVDVAQEREGWLAVEMGNFIQGMFR